MELAGIQVPSGIEVEQRGNRYRLFGSANGLHDGVLTRFAAKLQRQGWTVRNTGRGWFKVATPPAASDPDPARATVCPACGATGTVHPDPLVDPDRQCAACVDCGYIYRVADNLAAARAA